MFALRIIRRTSRDNSRYARTLLTLIKSVRFRQRNNIQERKRERESLTSESLVKLREVGENGQSIGHGAGRHVLGVQERGDPEVLLGRPESQLVVPVHIVLVQTVEVAATKQKKRAK